MLAATVRPATQQRPPTASPVPDSTAHAAAGTIRALNDAIEELRGRRPPRPTSDGAEPGPEADDQGDQGGTDPPVVETAATRAEIEDWIRDELMRAEERIRDDAEATRDRLSLELQALVKTSIGERVAELEAAAEARLAERAAQLEARADQARVETEEQIEKAYRTLSFKERRHELKLARQERNRRIESAERRLGARGEVLAAGLRRQATEAEKRIRETELEAERRLGDAAQWIAEALRRDFLDAAAAAGVSGPVVEGGMEAQVRTRRFRQLS
jgi:hypothetical protein